ncbi:GPR108 isoform 12, partial [Pongo abelii]
PAEWGQRLLLLLLLGGCSGRIHRLALTGEKRADIQLNSFGFYTNGSLEVELSLLRLGLREAEEKSLLVGFSLSRVRSGRVHTYSGPGAEVWRAEDVVYLSRAPPGSTLQTRAPEATGHSPPQGGWRRDLCSQQAQVNTRSDSGS